MAPKKPKSKSSSRTIKKTTVNAKKKPVNNKHTVKVGWIGKLYESPSSLLSSPTPRNTDEVTQATVANCGGKYKQKRCCDVSQQSLDNTLSKKKKEKLLQTKKKYCKNYSFTNCCPDKSTKRFKPITPPWPWSDTSESVATTSWNVAVYTSDVNGAGTDARIEMKVSGINETSKLPTFDILNFPKTTSEMFKKKKTDTFNFELDSELVELQTLDVAAFSNNERDKWHLNKVVFTEKDTGHTVEFKYNNWVPLTPNTIVGQQDTKSRSPAKLNAIIQPHNPRDILDYPTLVQMSAIKSTVTNQGRKSPKQPAKPPPIKRNTNSSSSIKTEESYGAMITNQVYQCNHVPITITLNTTKKDLGYTLKEQSNSKYMWIKSNVIVSDVTTNSLSEKVGLKVGDIILSINGVNIESIINANEEIAAVKENVENSPINFNDNGTGVTTSLLLIVYRDPEYSDHKEYLP